MASVDVLVAFAIATMTYAAVPGPGTIYIAAQAMAHDTGAALRAVLGLHVGGYVIVFAAAAGLTTLFAVVPTLYEGLKLLGALYIIWLGIQVIVFRSDTDAIDTQIRATNRPPATFRQSVLVEILNPTTAIFYVAFLPQFIAPNASLPVWLQFFVLGVLVNVIFTLPDFVAILFAGRVKKVITMSVRARRMFQWIGGSILICLGLRMATQRV